MNRVDMFVRFRWIQTTKQSTHMLHLKGTIEIMVMRKFHIVILACIAFGVSSAFATPPSDFAVATADHTSTFTLSGARGKIVVLHFLLKTECPICLKHTRDYAEKASKLPDVIEVFLKPDAEAAVI